MSSVATNGSEPHAAATVFNGAAVAANGAAGAANGAAGRLDGSSAATADAVTVPIIPHITANIIPLAHVLKFYARESYKQLTNVIENLSINGLTELDAKRKRQFLEVIIALRHDFIKVYTLVKWATVLQDILRLIDLLNWFRLQDLYFDQLSMGIGELSRFLGAKLPNPDLLTAIEVLVQGRPQLPSYGLLAQPPVSARKVLDTLRDLNLVLTARLALMSTEATANESTAVPLRMLRHSAVADGRIYLLIPHEFEVSISIANDVIVYNHLDMEEYATSPFYFVDFKFLFGIDPETLTIRHARTRTLGDDDDDSAADERFSVTHLPAHSFRNLERLSNQVLLSTGLGGLYKLLHRYAVLFKLYLLLRQLRHLSLNSKWRGNIQYQYHQGKRWLIVVNYWSNQHLLRGWRSFIELGIDHEYRLSIRWFKDGAYVADGGHTQDGEELSVETVLYSVASRHSEDIMQRIFSRLSEAIAGLQQEQDAVQSLSPHQVAVQLTPTKSTVFAINPLTGSFYFIDPSPLQQLATRQINTMPAAKSDTGKFIAEDEMVTHIIAQLLQLRLETFKREIDNKLVTTEWIPNDTIRLSDAQTAQLQQPTHKASRIQHYRRRNWPSSWFLVTMADGATLATHWWVARIKSVRGEWRLQWLQRIADQDPTSPISYQYCSTLSVTCSNMIIDHIVLEELQARNVGFVKLKGDSILKKLGLLSTLPSVKDEDAEVIYEQRIGLHNNGLFPVNNSATLIVLKVELVNHRRMGSLMRLRVVGPLRNVAISSKQLGAHIRLLPAHFEIDDEVHMNQAIGTLTGPSELFLTLVFEELSRLNKIIQVITRLDQHGYGSQVKNLTLDRFEVALNDNFGDLVVHLTPQGIQFDTHTSAAFLKNVVREINRYITTSTHSASSSVTGAIRYIHQVTPILDYVTQLRHKFDSKQAAVPRLSNGISRVNLDTLHESLETIRLVFTINSFAPQSKKMAKDRISFVITVKNHKFFDEGNQLLYLMSYKSNFRNPGNMKYKKIFENVFSRLQESTDTRLIKMNHDVVMTDASCLEYVFNVLSECLGEL